MPKTKPKQAEINIGMIGHVDHGKSTLVQAFSGVFPDTHSEEIRRGISIRLGYADCEFRKCSKCPEPDCFTTDSKCPSCGGKTKLLRRVSFVDAPGHEVLMATMLSGASIMDAVILVIATNETCPMPQTREHMAAMSIVGLDNIIIVQNKIELVSEEKVKKNFKDIQEFVKNSRPDMSLDVIPISAIHKANLDILIGEIEKKFPTIERDKKLDPRMSIARSFDIIKPGTPPESFKGGVIGGSITQGAFKTGEEIEIRPGMSRGNNWKPIITEITSLQSGFGLIKQALPGGLIGIGTKMDPALTKNDKLVGHIVGKPGTLPPVWRNILFEANLLERVVGGREEIAIRDIARGDRLMLNIGTAKTVGTATELGGNKVKMNLLIPVCADKETRIAISTQIEGRWRLIGWGILKDGDLLY